jgi:hypothetical protein
LVALAAATFGPAHAVPATCDLDDIVCSDSGTECTLIGVTCSRDWFFHSDTGEIYMELEAGSLGFGRESVTEYVAPKSTSRFSSPVLAIVYSATFKVSATATFDEPVAPSLFRSGTAAARAFLSLGAIPSMCNCRDTPASKQVVALGARLNRSFTLTLVQGDRSHFVKPGSYTVFIGLAGTASVGSTVCEGPDLCAPSADTGRARVRVQGFMKPFKVLIYRLGMGVAYAPPDSSLNSEYVVLYNPAPFPISLRGWTVRDRQGHTYTFGSVSLGRGKSLRLHSGAGRNTATDVYWGLRTGVWDDSADTLIVSDPNRVSVRCAYVASNGSRARVC